MNKIEYETESSTEELVQQVVDKIQDGYSDEELLETGFSAEIIEQAHTYLISVFF